MYKRLLKSILILIIGCVLGFLFSKLYYNQSYKDYSQSCNIESDETGIRTMSIKEANVECGCDLARIVDKERHHYYVSNTLFSKSISEGDTLRFSVPVRGIYGPRGLIGTMSRNSERYFFMGTIDTLIEQNRK